MFVLHQSVAKTTTEQKEGYNEDGTSKAFASAAFAIVVTAVTDSKKEATLMIFTKKIKRRKSQIKHQTRRQFQFFLFNNGN